MFSSMSQPRFAEQYALDANLMKLPYTGGRCMLGRQTSSPDRVISARLLGVTPRPVECERKKESSSCDSVWSRRRIVYRFVGLGHCDNLGVPLERDRNICPIYKEMEIKKKCLKILLIY